MQWHEHIRDGDASGRDARHVAAARTSRHAVQRLQSRIGNAATARMLAQVAAPHQPAKRRTLQRFNEAEHRALGDLALDAHFRLPAGTMFPDLQLTFGDWIALGDYFEDMDEIKRLLKPGPGPSQAGQVYYAVLVKIRPKDAAERRRAKEAAAAAAAGKPAPDKDYLAEERAKVVKDYEKTELWTEDDVKEVEKRYVDLASRNIKHFPNPLLGDTTRPTADKVGREPGGKPLGAMARYHHDHLDAVRLAMSAGELREERYLGEAYAMDGFACHFLTDAFSGSHVRTPRASIKSWWDPKVPHFDDRLLEWMTDEITWVVETEPDSWEEWAGATLDQLNPTQRYGLIRDGVRKKIKPKLPATSFGDLVSSLVHDWEGEHGADGHGPLVTVAGQRFRTVGDGDLFKAVLSLGNKTPTDTELDKLLRHKGSGRLDDAQRTFAAAELAVRRSVHDLKRAYDLALRGDRRDTIMAELQGKDGLFASERLLPIAVPDPELPEADRMPKWDFATVDELLNAPKIHEQLPITAKSLTGRFDVKTLPGSAAVKAHVTAAVVTPLKSGKPELIIDFLHKVLAYSPDDLRRRISGTQSGLRQDLAGLGSRRH